MKFGERKEEVEIDGRTTAADVIRKVGADPERHVLILNGITRAPEDKILPLLTGDDELRVVPKTKAGSSSNFFTGKKRMKMEETLLRELGFYPIAKNVYRGVVKAGDRVLDMDVVFPETFPFARPMILIYDEWFLGKHPCIIARENGIEVHFEDACWRPWMHAADLVASAVDFLDRIAGVEYVWKKFQALISSFRSLRRL